MSRVGEVSDVPDELLAEAANWYYERARQVPAAFSGYPKAAVQLALKLAEGNWHRMIAEDDGSILVMNHPVW